LRSDDWSVAEDRLGHDHRVSGRRNARDARVLEGPGWPSAGREHDQLWQERRVDWRGLDCGRDMRGRRPSRSPALKATAERHREIGVAGGLRDDVDFAVERVAVVVRHLRRRTVEQKVAELAETPRLVGDADAVLA